MSTQHPDNVSLPFFAESQPMGGEDEITEAYYAFSHLGCEEQMWDFEGKEVDEFVVRKLLTRYGNFFREHPLGRDFFLTLRVPNPIEEKGEAKVLLEVLESIPRSFDSARLFDEAAPPPVFEIILPMTRTSAELERIRYYYETYVGGKGNFVFPDGTRLESWIGGFAPHSIEIIPLFEDMDGLINSASVVRDCTKARDLSYQRVFLARSDPALNYGHLAAVMSLKIALHRLEELEGEWGKPVYPIIGVGSCPFRGNLKPTNVQNCLRGYPSIQTFTIQSAFKYDYPPEDVVRAVRELNSSPRGKAIQIVDEPAVIALARRVSAAYRAELKEVAPLVSRIAPYVPARRQRKLHIGLFGYSRGTEEFTLPRAIGFCASLYSIGFPPEVLGLSGLGQSDLEIVGEVYPDFREDLTDALVYFNEESLALVPSLKPKVLGVLRRLGLSDWKADADHCAVTSKIIKQSQVGDDIKELVVEAASMRRFLG